MAVTLAQIRQELLPGLFAIQGSYDAIPAQWARVFALDEVVAPLPSVSLPQALIMGAAAVVITNPEVTRRGLLGWLDRLHK
jgi:hypothetical protein